MYKLAFVYFVGVAIVFTVAQQVDVVRYENDNDGLGNYRFIFEQTDGTKHEQIGELRNAGTDNAYVVQRGSYSYIAPDGLWRLVKYVADENGYQVEEEQPPLGLPPSATASLLG